MTASMRRNEDVCLHAMLCNLDWCVWKLDPPVFTWSFLTKAAGFLQKNCCLFPSIAEQGGIKFWTQAVAQQPQLLKVICSMVGADDSNVIDAELQRSGVSLQFADKRTQSDFRKAVLAVTQNNSAIHFVDESIREAVEAHVQNSSDQFRSV
jgi:hypothetical protein